MGTNFYLQRKKPTLHETIHIGKQSFGWLFHWDSVDEGVWPRWCDEDHSYSFGENGEEPEPVLPHSIHSVEDIRSYIRTGEWELIDEEGKVYEDPLARIDELCSWDGGVSAWNARNPDRPLEWERPRRPSGYTDSEGQVFDRGNGFC